MTEIQDLQKIATQIRRDILRMVHAVNSGHPGGSLGCADLFTALYFKILENNPGNFNISGDNEDIFYLSNGHISPAWYSVLARSGHFPIEELSTFRKIDTRLQGHPTPAEGLEGVRIASGSLGQGLSVAVGTALAKKLNNDTSLVYCLQGDGEIQEGQVWEAAMFAAHNKVDNLIAIIDYNSQQIDGPVNEVLSLGNLKAKWESFGWKTLETNGNDMTMLVNSLKQAKSESGNGLPIVIIMQTEMGFGVDFMTGTHKWHGVAPNDDQLAEALKQLPETIGDY